MKKPPLTIDVEVHAELKVLPMGGSKQALIRIKTEFQTLDAASRSVSIDSTVHLLDEARWLDGRKEGGFVVCYWVLLQWAAGKGGCAYDEQG